MKKSILIFCVCAVLALTACGKSDVEETVTETTTELSITETFPETTVAEATVSETTSVAATEATTVSEAVTETAVETSETQVPVTTSILHTTTTASATTVPETEETAIETTTLNPKSTDHFLTGMEIEAPAEIPNGWMTETATETTAVTEEVVFDFVADPIVFTYDEECDYEEKLEGDKLIKALSEADKDDIIPVYVYLKYSSDALYLDKARDDAVYRENYALGDVIQKLYLSYLRDYNKAFADEITGGDKEKIVTAHLTLILELTPDELIKAAKCEQVNSMSFFENVEMSND